MRPFIAALSLLAAASIVGLVLPTGLRAQYFLGSNFEGAPVRTALDRRFTTLELSRRWGYRPPDAFSVQWAGYLFVDREGVYTFSVAADDGSRLYIDRQAIVEEAGQGPGVRTGRVRLDRGAHAVALQYAQLGGAYHLAWTWAREDEAPRPVPGWALSPRARGAAAALVARWQAPIWWLLVGVSVGSGARLLWGRRRALAREDEGAPAPMPWRSGALCLALFGLFAAAHTWPLASDPARLSRNDNADTLLNEWILAWTARQLAHEPLRLFDANIFYPERYTLAYSEPLIVQSVLGAPLFWLGASPVLVYNVVLLLGFTLTGWTMALLVARWTGDWIAGIASGVIVAFNAHTLTRLPHLQAQHAEFLPLVLWSLDALLRRPRWSSAVWLAVWFTLQALTSVYLLVFTTIALGVALLARPENWAGGAFARVMPRLVVAAGLSALMLVPVLLPYWRLHEAGFARSIDEVAWFSATVRDYASTPSRLYGMLGLSAGGATSLFPGAAALLLTAAAVVVRPGLADPRLRMCAAFGLAGVVLSFGPIVPGYATLYFASPLLQAIRGSARFGYLGLVAVAVGAGYGVAALRRRLTGRPRVNRWATAAVIAVVFLEPFAAPIGYQPFAGIPDIYRRVAGEPDAVVAHLPFPPPEAIFRNAPYMLGSTLHFRPMLNGYSGFMPRSYVEHYGRLADFPTGASVAALRDLRVTHLFVHLDRLEAGGRSRVAEQDGLREIAVEGSIALYRVTAADERH